MSPKFEQTFFRHCPVYFYIELEIMRSEVDLPREFLTSQNWSERWEVISLLLTKQLIFLACMKESSWKRHLGARPYFSSNAQHVVLGRNLICLRWHRGLFHQLLVPDYVVGIRLKRVYLSGSLCLWRSLRP